MSAWTQFWSERTTREKALIIAGGTLLVLAVLYGVLWAPARAHRDQLENELPAMRRDVAQMREQAAAVRALGPSATGAAPVGSALQETVNASLTQHGIAAAQVSLAGNGVRIQAKNIAFSAWVAWLNDARRQIKMQVIESHVKALAQDGQVDLDALLQPPARVTSENR